MQRRPTFAAQQERSLRLGERCRLAKLRAPLLVGFGFVTYAIVPVLPFALLLAVIGCTVARFERRTVLAFVTMVLVAIVRFATL